MKKTGALLAGIGAFTALIGLPSQISVGVIGGADGPTAVFGGGSSGDFFSAVGIFAGIVLLSAGIMMIRGKRSSGSPRASKKGK